MADDLLLAGGASAPSPSRAERLALAASSPERAGAHDREGWYALFADGASVEDPVGTPACRKGQRTAGLFGRDDALLAFFDAFIAGNDVRFEIHQDIVVGLSVARDVTIHTRMPLGFVSSVKAYLLYELAPEHGALRIARLGAHWEASGNTKQALSAGLRGSVAMALSIARMVRHLGPIGTRAYVRGTQEGVRRPGREAVAAFAEALTRADAAALERVVTSRATIALGDEGDRPVRGIVEAVPGLSLHVWDAAASGYVVACRCEVKRDGRVHRGLAFFEFDRPTRTIARARILYER